MHTWIIFSVKKNLYTLFIFVLTLHVDKVRIPVLNNKNVTPLSRNAYLLLYFYHFRGIISSLLLDHAERSATMYCRVYF